MAFRRFAPSRRRFASSRFRGRRGLQTPHRPRKWERGNFFIQDEHRYTDPLDPRTSLSVFVLGQTDRIADHQGTEIGRSLAEAVRYLEIGGIVWNTSVTFQRESGFTAPEPGDSGVIDARVLLCSDRLDGTQPASPAATTCNWFTNTQPITTIHETQDEQQAFPTQIHHQDFWRINSAAYNGRPDGLDITGLATSPTVEHASRSHSKRFRVRLDDQSAFVVHFASQILTLAEAELDLAVSFRIMGTIYYRFVFGSR